MTRDEVLEMIRAHLADELELDPARVTEETHFKRDLDADSLDLYTVSYTHLTLPTICSV